MLLPGMLLLFFVNAATGQVFKQSSVAADRELHKRSVGAIKIVAIMVEFKRDDNRFTSGDGTFHLSYLDRDDIIIDPLPHDRPYFEAHLEFVSNYFSRVSGGMLEVDYEVLPRVYQLDEEMSSYAPLGDDGSENYKLAELARDAWQKASASGDLDPGEYDPERTMFVVFHAGAGRDLELTGTTLNKTPQDIPSVYLSQDALGRLLGLPAFEGFPVDDSDFRITNTAILPQTQSRAGQDFTGEEFVLQLSINGILTATAGSFIGLPDLFNTDTGASGIGRFGLMDGASIFSYLGMFPPEPSAWEKVYLGWQQPFDIRLDEELIELPAAALREPNSIARHRISGDEYFLVENRHRDPDGQGVTLTIQTPDGNRVEHRIENTDTWFDPFNSAGYRENLTPGVVVDVSNFDWSLPGGFDIGEDGVAGTDDDRILNGGMLIWHIDEAVIRSSLSDNTVNNNPLRRGVALVEADGARDIGRPVHGLDGSRFAQGHAFDFWWSGNDFTVITATGSRIIVYENRFGKDTRPSNHSNTGSPSFFEFFDFSDNLPTARFRARHTSGELYYEKPIAGSLDGITGVFNTEEYSSGWPLSLGLYTSNSDSVLIIPSPESVFGIGVNEQAPDFMDFQHRSPHQPLINDMLVITGNRRITENETPTRSWRLNNGTWETVWENSSITSAAGLISSFTGDTLDFDLTRDRLVQSDGLRGDLPPVAMQRSQRVTGVYAVLQPDRLVLSDGSFETSLGHDQTNSVRLYAGSISRDSQPWFFLLHDYGLDLIRSGHNEPYSPWIRETRTGWPALVDFSNDGYPDAIFIDRETNRLNGMNIHGTHLDYFPVDPPRGTRFTGTPIIADLNGDSMPEILVAVQDSLSLTIRGYDHRLRPLQGFPLYVGSIEDYESDPIHPVMIDQTLYAVSHRGDLKAWTFPGAGEVLWKGQYGNEELNKVGAVIADDTVTENHTGLLNSQETYNWPNPVTDETFIRFQTREAADIDITVINMSGATVFETTAASSGETPGEVRVSTSAWGSGVYYCRVTATARQTTETQLIKILVIQ